jgi:hypothetical protein
MEKASRRVREDAWPVATEREHWPKSLSLGFARLAEALPGEEEPARNARA